jgi:hypothetical protein
LRRLDLEPTIRAMGTMWAAVPNGVPNAVRAAYGGQERPTISETIGPLFVALRPVRLNGGSVHLSLLYDADFHHH